MSKLPGKDVGEAIGGASHRPEGASSDLNFELAKTEHHQTPDHDG